jgi:hypothetical protein
MNFFLVKQLTKLKVKKNSKIFLEKFAFYGLDMDLEPEPEPEPEPKLFKSQNRNRNRNRNK